jgi:hypothetical protein
MKLLFIYVSPNKKFDDETEKLCRLQIDNSILHCWKREDILLVTNFKYEYREVTSLLVPDDLFYSLEPPSSKTLVIEFLLRREMLKDGELYWYHDFDAYQNTCIDEFELEMGGFDLGLTPYGYKPEWNCGSLFFRTTTQGMFSIWAKRVRDRIRRGRADEQEIRKMIRDNQFDNVRWKSLNVSYNFTMRYTWRNYPNAIKPLRLLHFHPYYHDHLLPDTLLNIFMYGKNRSKVVYMSNGLINLFHQYGIR